MRKIFHNLLTLILLTVQFGIFLPGLFAQNADQPPVPDVDNLSARLSNIEQSVEERRLELGIPGLSLAIVKDDKIIFSKGFGLRDMERKLPVTPETLFGIGSSTKAFTAMTIMMSADQGRLSLDDSPKKFLPYFKLRDPEADSKVTLRDLLSHRTGLARTDLALSFANGKLTREDLIKVAGVAKPTFKLGQKFQYQNVMYAAAGEIAAKANNTTYEDLVETRILNPLGMNQTNLTLAGLKGSPDFSFGYDYNPETKTTKQLNTLDISIIAPVGAINSNARDMSKWLRLLLGGGVFEGKRLVSEKNFNEMWTQQIQIGPKTGYGLAWFLRDWRGKKEVDHGGNIDGYNAMVAMIPEEHLGLVMLSNVSASSMADEIREIVYSNLLGKIVPGAPKNEAEKNPSPASNIQSEVGEYFFEPAQFKLKISLKDGKLVASTNGQPDSVLESIGGRRYKVPSMEGFFLTFRPIKGNERETELYLEQPQGNAILTKLKTVSTNGANTTEISPVLKEIVGSYESERSGLPVEIAASNGVVTITLKGQPSRRLTEKSKDNFAVEDTPDNFVLSVKRDENGKPNGLVYNQGGIVAPLRQIVALTGAPSAEELMNKVVEAIGGESNLRKHNSMKIEMGLDFENQGVTGESVLTAKATNKAATNLTYFAFGKKIGTVFDFFDGREGGSFASVGTPFILSGKVLEDARIASDFYAPLDWKQLFRSITVKRMSKVGEEEVYVVEKIPEKGNPITDYISTQSNLVLRRDSLQPQGFSDYTLPKTETFSDYRTVDGVKMPFKIISSDPDGGSITTIVKSIQFNVLVPDNSFNPSSAKTSPNL